MSENATPQPLSRQVGDEDTIALADLADRVIRGGSEHNFYSYKKGDEYLQIIDEGGTNILILHDIHSDEITVKKRQDDFYVVLLDSMPIIEFRGIQYIQVSDGCYNITTRWGA